MRVMSKRQKEVLQKLVRLANGDWDLVERAMREAGKGEQTPSVGDVTAYIKSATARRSHSS
jgi:uncharacterized protein HemY